jgi:hypothetical protein
MRDAVDPNRCLNVLVQRAEGGGVRVGSARNGLRSKQSIVGDEGAGRPRCQSAPRWRGLPMANHETAIGQNCVRPAARKHLIVAGLGTIPCHQSRIRQSDLRIAPGLGADASWTGSGGLVRSGTDNADSGVPHATPRPARAGPGRRGACRTAPANESTAAAGRRRRAARCGHPVMRRIHAVPTTRNTARKKSVICKPSR